MNKNDENFQRKFSFKVKYFTFIFNIIFSFELINNKKKNMDKIPNISVFLPIYNKELYLKISIGSIMKQTLQNLEIITVNDGSTDNTLNVLKKLAKKDPRIKIINNDRNHGLLYSRAMGILNSTGEYVMNLDPDDKFEGQNNLKLLYNKVKTFNLDYIHYLIKRIPKDKSQIEICNKLNKMQLNIKDYLITNKLIKRKIILKAFKDFIKYIYKDKWNYHEDHIWNLLIKKYSNSFKIIKKYIYIYIKNNKSLNFNKNNEIETKNQIYRLKMLFEINKNLTLFEFNNYYKTIIISYNNLFIKNKEIIKKIIIIYLNAIKFYNNNNTLFNKINY